MRGLGRWWLVPALLASFAFLLYLHPPRLPQAQALGEFLVRFFPPDLSPKLLAHLMQGTQETLAIAGLSTLLAVLAALPLALAAGGRGGPLVRLLTRFLLNFLRAVPELVWAAIIVLATGLGPFAGLLALAIHTSGVLGRLFAEVLENEPPQVASTLRLTGARPVAAFLYGSLPAVLPYLLMYILYRMEHNIRMALIMGFVGAGGLGQALHQALSLFQQPQAMTVITMMVLLVICIDGLSSFIRRRL